jgi:beta-mannosidase
MTTRSLLHDGWKLRLPDQEHLDRVPEAVRAAMPIAATVPGTVHTDLLAAGLIADPYLDQNELTLDWIGNVTWEYVLEFAVEPGVDVESVLAFDGLDTIASVRLNNAVLLQAQNMHRRYEVAVTEVLRPGVNTLSVTFHSAIAFAESERARIGDLPNAYPAAFNYIRKMACNFGWDWGPSLVTAGIWRPVHLIQTSDARLVSVTPTVTVAGPRGAARFAIELASAQPHPLTVRATVGDAAVSIEVPPGDRSVELEVVVEQPRLWWPRGLGSPDLYDAEVAIVDEDGAPLDVWRSAIGFRSLRLETTPDAHGTPFVFIINDVTIPIRGANWIPDDCFLPRVTDDRLRTRIGQAADANINLLRVWGGGVYESEEFYRACDESGILVWQDFLFACAAYPEDAALRSEVLAEARDNVQRLTPHPSLVLWNGNNENIWGWFDWDWRQHLENRTWGLGYYLDLLPSVVAEVDPARPYWAGSPYSGSMELHPNLDEHGLKHVWDVWNQRDYTAYRDSRPRFVSEFGWQAPPTWSTLTRAVHDDPLTPTSPGVLHHQKANDGNGKLDRGLAPHLPAPRDTAEWMYLMQLNQARAVSFGVEWYRSLRPLCFGTIVWQLNDCWPVTSWAAIDGDGRKKPLWYALRDSYSTRLLTVQPNEGSLEVVGVNDGGDTWREPVTVRRMTFDGRVIAEYSDRLVADRGGVARLRLPAGLVAAGDPAREVLVATTDTGIRALHYFAEDRDLHLASGALHASVQAAVQAAGDVAVLTLTAGAELVRGVCVFADRVAPAAEADRSVFDLLPGETVIVRVTGVPPESLGRLTDPLVTRSLNDLVDSSRPTAVLTT